VPVLLLTLPSAYFQVPVLVLVLRSGEQY
jgi:hypothetical protein